MKRLNFFYLLIAVLFNIRCNAQDSKPELQDIHDSVVTIISQLSPEKELDIYHIGIKDMDAFPSVLKRGVRDSIEFHIVKPTFLNIGLLSLTPLYVKPGDRIIVANDSLDDIHFNNARYPERSDELNLFFKLNKYIERIGKKNIVSETETELNFLDSLKDVQNLSAKFLQDAKHYINYKGLQFSYLHKLKNKVSNGNLQPFPQNDSCIYLFSYRGALYSYLILLSRKHNSKEFDFNLLNELAKNNLSGDTKKCALFMLLNYRMNTLLTQPEYVVAYNEFLHSYPKDNLTNYLKDSYDEKIATDNSFEKDVYKELLVNTANKLIPFSVILQKSEGKIIVLDFWAQYCGPCLSELPYSKKIEKEFSHDNVIFLYFSMDHQYNRWLENIVDLGIGDSNRSYLLYLPEKSGILKYFKIETIPRYVIIGKDGKIISRDAPRPNDPGFRKLIKENL